MILKLLKERPMTRAELSRELKLAPATVSQHLANLESSGAIFVDNNDNSRKWKYYKLNRGFNMNNVSRSKDHSAAFALGGIAVTAIVAILVLSIVVSPRYAGVGVNTPSALHIPAPGVANTTIANSTIMPGGIVASCPIILTNGKFGSKISDYSGLGYYNDSGLPEYIIAPGANGSMVLSLSKPQSSQNISISNFAAFYYTSHYNYNGSSVGGYGTNSVNGLTISFNRTSENLTTISPNATVLISIDVARNAPLGIYMVIVPEGPCKPDGSSFLLTVGSKPYTGRPAARIIN